MNVGSFVQPTPKGQVIIPANFRKLLGINENTLLNVKVYAGGVHFQPVSPIVLVPDSNAAFLEFLKENRGAWGMETLVDKKNEEKIRKLELSSVKRSKNAW